ncbi:BT_3044 domain-containing protein [Sphingobacterium sp. LRF_L2]|uniref:BT_3044 domain-containing protein n=1 Tax=Sphingobacterium sp. LRF_L2 TaxID=3369421 RepID=UPI003F5FFBC7
MRNYIFLTTAIFLMLFNACNEENPLDVEQYMKQVYIVGANQSNNEGLLTVDVPYVATADEEAETYISLAVGGSQYIDRDIMVNVEEAGSSAVDQYNFMYLYKDDDIQYRMLGASYYRIPSKSVTIKSNNIYARMPIYVKTYSFERDSLLALTFKITDVSDPDYVKIRETDTVLMFSVAMYNSYSGDYTMTGSYYQYGKSTAVDTVSVVTLRELEATSYNSVRLFHLANTESIANAAEYGIKIVINSDNTLTLQPWGNLALTDGGGGYDPTNKKFTFWYNYTVSGVVYQFKGNLVMDGV